MNFSHHRPAWLPLKCALLAVLLFIAMPYSLCDLMEQYEPLSLARRIAHCLYPDLVIDGELAYDFLLGDAFLFWTPLFFAALWFLFRISSAKPWVRSMRKLLILSIFLSLALKIVLFAFHWD